MITVEFILRSQGLLGIRKGPVYLLRMFSVPASGSYPARGGWGRPGRGRRGSSSWQCASPSAGLSLKSKGLVHSIGFIHRTSGRILNLLSGRIPWISVQISDWIMNILTNILTDDGYLANIRRKWMYLHISGWILDVYTNIRRNNEYLDKYPGGYWMYLQISGWILDVYIQISGRITWMYLQISGWILDVFTNIPLDAGRLYKYPAGYWTFIQISVGIMNILINIRADNGFFYKYPSGYWTSMQIAAGIIPWEISIWTMGVFTNIRLDTGRLYKYPAEYWTSIYKHPSE